MNIKVLKLRSGEEIACQILEQDTAVCKIFQPMLFKTVSSYDEVGRPYDITTLTDWLINTDDKNINLPSDHIVFVTEPNTYSLELYTLESEREFNSPIESDIVDMDELNSGEMDALGTIEDLSNLPLEEAPSSNEKEPLDIFAMFLEQLTNNPNMMFDQNSHKKRRPMESSEDEDDSSKDRHMILMQFYIPAAAIMNLVTSGMLEPKVLKNMVREVKKRNKFTGDEKDRPDFGNKFSDWNPDPKSDDYIG